MDCNEVYVYELLYRASDLGFTNVYRCARGRYNHVDLRDFTSLHMSRDDVGDDDDEVLTTRHSFHNGNILIQSIYHNKDATTMPIKLVQNTNTVRS